MIYLTIEDLPKKIYVGQVFPVTVKITSLKRHVPYTVVLKGGRNVTAINAKEFLHTRPQAIRRMTFWFKAEGGRITLPSFVVRYEDDSKSYRIEGVALTAVRLNPPADFCGILARDMELVNYQASVYDDNSSILALKLHITYGNANDFRLPRAMKQGIDSLEGDINDTTLLYYGVYPADVEHVDFSYFNLSKNRYEKFQVPVLVKRDTVSTQTNLDPQASEFTRFKIAATLFFILLWFILWYRSGKWIYPVLILLAGAYLVTYLIPLKTVCIEKGTTVYLLPTPQSTPFMRLEEQTEAKEMDRRSGYIKIELPNNRIGWIKHENLCTP